VEHLAAAEAVRRTADRQVVPEAGTAVAGLVAAGRQGRTEELPVKKVTLAFYSTRIRASIAVHVKTNIAAVALRRKSRARVVWCRAVWRRTVRRGTVRSLLLPVRRRRGRRRSRVAALLLWWLLPVLRWLLLVLWCLAVLLLLRRRRRLVATARRVWRLGALRSVRLEGRRVGRVRGLLLLRGRGTGTGSASSQTCCERHVVGLRDSAQCLEWVCDKGVEG
jgi:hypothetical protein